VQKWRLLALVGLLVVWKARTKKIECAWAVPSRTDVLGGRISSSYALNKDFFAGHSKRNVLKPPSPRIMQSTKQLVHLPVPIALREKVLRTTGEVFLEMFVYSTLWMAISLASLVPFVQLVCGMTLDMRPFWTAAFEGLFVYSLDHLKDTLKSKGSQSLPEGRRKLRLLLLGALLVFAAVALACSLMAAHSPLVTLTFLGHMMLCVGYVKLKRLMPYGKAFYVSACVLFMALAAPCACAPALLNSLTGASFLQLVLLLVSVSQTVEQLQDLRDLEEDKEAQVVTLASGLGEYKARQFLLRFQAVSLFLHFFLMQWARLPVRPHFLVVHLACCVCAISFNRQTPRTLFQVLLEPLYLLPLGATLLRAHTGFSL